MYYFCTYFDNNYLDKGLALYYSLTEHCQPFKLWVLCMDETTYKILTCHALPGIRPILLSDFEKGNTALLEAKQNRSLIEYYFTCTPSLIEYVINHNPEVDIVTYLDADLYFFSSIEPVYKELKHGSVLIIPHRFPENLKHLEIYGIYNVGLLSFRTDKSGRTCLEWWKDRCLEWCYDRLEDGKFADQKYLDDWPTRFINVIVCQNKAVGLAPWNLSDYDGLPVIVYHFHGVRRVNSWIWDLGLSGYKAGLSGMVRNQIYVPYLKKLNSISTSNPTTTIRKLTTNPLRIIFDWIVLDPKEEL